MTKITSSNQHMQSIWPHMVTYKQSFLITLSLGYVISELLKIDKKNKDSNQFILKSTVTITVLLFLFFSFFCFLIYSFCCQIIKNPLRYMEITCGMVLTQSWLSHANQGYVSPGDYMLGSIYFLPVSQVYSMKNNLKHKHSINKNLKFLMMSLCYLFVFFHSV